MRLLIFPLLLMLAGCGAVLQRGAEKADTEAQSFITAIRKLNDAQAKAYIAVPCAIDVGAYYRVLSSRQRSAVDLACDPGAGVPETSRSFTVDDLQKLGIVDGTVSVDTPAEE